MKHMEGERQREMPQEVYAGLNSAEYQSERQRKKRLSEKSIFPFGYAYPETVTHDSDFDKQKKIVFAIERMKRIPFSKDRLLQRPSGDPLRRLFFVEALSDSDICAQGAVQIATDHMVGHPDAATRLEHAFLVDSLPDSVIEMMLDRHSEVFFEIQRQFSEHLPVMKKDFIDRLTRLQRNGGHPISQVSLSEDYINDRLNEVAVVAADPLQLSIESGAAGEYDHEENTAVLAFETGFNPKEQERNKKLFAHEMAHVISGRTIKEAKGGFVSKRIGLQQHGDFKIYGDHVSFTWLNEAITETLAQDLFSQTREYDKGAYSIERNIYKKLLLRVDEKLFLQAYFENYTPGQDPDHPPSWEVLRSACQEAYGTDILQAIDDAVRRGIDYNPTPVVDRFEFDGSWKE